MKSEALVLLGIAIISLIAVPLVADEHMIHLIGIVVSQISDDELIRYAMEARNYSYSPYSHYNVGAAVLTDSGVV